MKDLGTFPFGQPIRPVVQTDRSRKRVFILGVYASAVHARWIGPGGRQLIAALGVASEPEIFWRGDGAGAIIQSIPVPQGAGWLEPPGKNLNGPSGIALDERFLNPLGLTRTDAWLCDLVPHSCMNPGQAAAIARHYTPNIRRWNLPAPVWPDVPDVLASPARRNEIVNELTESRAEILITLGDQPLKWFARYLGSFTSLSRYGKHAATSDYYGKDAAAGGGTNESYGRLHPIEINGRAMLLLPLVHPRQAGRLGGYSKAWAELHDHWIAEIAPCLLSSDPQD
ncbi:MAG TPA: hypothetical protein PLV45_06595 [bacterium]|nr:hypothetical protein [bacterium]